MEELQRFINLKRVKLSASSRNFTQILLTLFDLSILSIESGQKPTNELPQPTYLRNNVAQKSLK